MVVGAAFTAEWSVVRHSLPNVRTITMTMFIQSHAHPRAHPPQKVHTIPPAEDEGLSYADHPPSPEAGFGYLGEPAH
eukprot:7417288-Lingulodinium_polyedra.AAC.1